MERFDPIAALVQLLDQERGRIVRLWAKRLRAELHGFDLPGADLRPPLAAHLEELARLLKDRGDEALRLWPETVRSIGMRRYDQRFDADDLAREFKALGQTLFYVYGKRHGAVEPEMAETLMELVGEAQAAAQASFARILRTEEVRFKEAAVMESILHHVGVGILFVDRDGHITFATHAVSRLLGLPLRALVGTSRVDPLAACLLEVDARKQDGRPFKVADMPYAQLLRTRSQGAPEWMVVHRGPNGDEVIVEMEATPIWEEGEIVGVIQTMTDRTESTQRAQELSRAYEELRSLQGRLVQRTRSYALSQLADGAAHALNNFLNVIRLRVTLLRKDFKPGHLDALDRTVHSIGELASRLQEFSVGSAEETVGVCSLSALAREAIDLAQPELSREGAQVEVEARLDPSARVNVDATLMRELLVNLLLAARDRLPEGGKVSLRLEEVDGWAHLRVEDEGRPYTQEELGWLFDPLKGRSSVPQRALLLAVGRSQVQRWGGELTGEARARGAAFRMRLPIAQATHHEEVAPAATTARRFQQTRRVLVVDDDPDNARMLADVLGDEGYETQVAHSGKEALAAWEARRFDAALLDALMPDMSGWELARELRKRSPQVLLGMVTGADVRGQNRHNLALIDGLFPKPIDVEALDQFLSQRAPRGAESAPTSAADASPAPP